jgi:hypothetical protein
MTALAAKKVTCDLKEEKIYEAFLGHNYPRFMQSYLIWSENTDFLKKE